MNPFKENPFTVLTFIVAPAILTNASSIMVLSTSNRLAKVFDRTQNHCGKFGSLVFAKRGGKTTRAVLTAVSLWYICTIDG
jgi:hypothetical protein